MAEINQTGEHPKWSPNDSRILFSNNKGIAVMNADGSNVMQITNNSRDTHAGWSPDGKQIVFDSWDGTDQEIYTINLDGTKRIQLTNNSANDYHPVWSLNSNKIAFDSGGEISLVNATGGKITTVCTGSDPFWSPDSSRILFVNGSIWSANQDGSNIIQLLNVTDAHYPVWG